jgi:16S rRNA (uracil1498-N3)-methyltransferase
MSRSSHRFRFPGIAEDGKLELDAASSHKAIRVLRLDAGDRIAIVDDTGAEFEADILSIKDGRVRILRGACTRPATTIGVPQPAPETAEVPAEAPSAPYGTVIALALIKPDRMDWAIEKVGETTAAAIWPFPAERSPVKTVSEARMERWRKISVSAALQSGRGLECPILDPAPDLAIVLAAARASWHLDPSGIPVRELIRNDSPPPRTLLVGPEGGWSEGERELLTRQSRPVSIGSSTLRAESAALIAAFLPSLLLSND